MEDSLWSDCPELRRKRIPGTVRSDHERAIGSPGSRSRYDKSPRLVERNRYFRTLRDRCRRLRVTTSCASSKQACAVDVVKEQLQAIVCTAYLATSVWLVDELTFCVGTSVDNAFRAPTNTSSRRSLHEISKWPKMQFQSIEFLWLNNYFRFWLPCWFLSILQAFNENIT